jgi:hypothetical protein
MRSESIEDITISRKAALRNSSRSLARASFFRPKPIERIALDLEREREREREREGRLAHRHPGRLSQVLLCLCLSLANGRSCTSASSNFLAFSSSEGLLPGAFPGQSGRPWRAAFT